MSVKQYLNALKGDILYDLALSYLDEAFGGVAGLDVGDFLAAILIYRDQRYVMGFFPTVIASWEATNFFPIGLIPGVGTSLEWALNLIPTTTILTTLFNKQGRAEEKLQESQSLTALASRLGLSVDTEYLSTAQGHLANNAPVKAIPVLDKGMRSTRRAVGKETRNTYKALGTNAVELYRYYKNPSNNEETEIKEGLQYVFEALDDTDKALQHNELQEAVNTVEHTQEALETIQNTSQW